MHTLYPSLPHWWNYNRYVLELPRNVTFYDNERKLSKYVYIWNKKINLICSFSKNFCCTKIGLVMYAEGCLVEHLSSENHIYKYIHIYQSNTYIKSWISLVEFLALPVLSLGFFPYWALGLSTEQRRKNKRSIFKWLGK